MTVQALYRHLPLSLQHMAVTLENSLVLHRKYGYLPLFRSLSTIQNDAIAQPYIPMGEDLALKKINELLSYATAKVPYYRTHRERYKRIERLGDIGQLPLFSKNDFRSNAAALVSEEASWWNAQSFRTSGTTGAPMTGRVSLHDLRLRYGILQRILAAAGFHLDRPYARFVGKPITVTGGPVWRNDLLHEHLFLSAYHVSDRTVEEYRSALLRYKVETLEGYPSAVFAFAVLLEKANLRVETIRRVFTTAEKLHPHMRETIERVFNCRVIDYYGSNEQSILAWSCTAGHMHLATDTGHLEVLDRNDRPVDAGEEGRMVVTGFTSRFMPLIRYEIGDRAIWGAANGCSCGLSGPFLKEILGRDEEIFVTRDGRHITRFSTVLKYLPPLIVESQLHLSRSNTQATLQYVGSIESSSSLFSDFKEKFSELMGREYSVLPVRMENIDRKSGKIRAVVIDD